MTASPVARRHQTAVIRRTRTGAIVFLLALALPLSKASAQIDGIEGPLLPVEIGETDIELRGRYVRQWREGDGTHVLLFNGGFQLDMGLRQLRANNAVVWIERQTDENSDRPYFQLTVYLSEEAEVRDLGGTTTEDQVLLVSNLKTFGRIVKYHDAHAPDAMRESPLYLQAVQDRALIETGQAPPETPKTADVARLAEIRRPRPAGPPRVIRYDLPNIEPAQTSTGEPVFVAVGGVYFSQEGGPDAPVLEITAENAVIFPAEGGAALLSPAEVAEQPVADSEPTPEPATPDAQPPATDDELRLMPKRISRAIRAVYLEGDVRLIAGARLVRAERIYYDFEREQALILDAVLRAEIPDRGIPLYVRAEEIRQLSTRAFSANNARVTTSEFHTPHYHVGAERVIISDLTRRDVSGQPTAAIAGTYELHNTTLNVGNLPVLWWPYSKGRFEASETALQSFRMGYSDDFGVELETRWELFNLIGQAPPPGFDADFNLDYYTERGPGIGVDADYQRDNHYGLLRSYYIYDDGEDSLGPLRRSQENPSTHNRGRFLWRHRHFLPRDWEATFEISYISDPNFLEEYYREEFNEGKDQETLIYLKRARGVEAITFLANWRLLDFTTQTEHLPDIVYRRIGDTFASPFVLYHESRIGGVRYRPDDRRFFDRYRFDNTAATDAVFRADARQEIELPIKLGPLNLVPFASFRGSYWTDAPAEDDLWRGLGVYGLRGSIAFSKVYDDIESDLFDIHRVRHIIKPDFAAWWAHSNTRSRHITPFDEGVETIDDFYGVTFGLRQTFQTKRGPVDNRRTVDFLTLDLEAGFFGDRQPWENSNGYANPIRPEDSRTRNYLAGELIYRLTDTTSLLYDFNIDVNDWSYDRHNVSLAVERTPRLAYVVGARNAGDIDMRLLGGGWNYKHSEKHLTAFRAWYDIEEGDLGEVAVSYVRKLPRWYLATTFEYDHIDDDFSVTISIWPEGVPEWTLGSRRFNTLSQSTGIRP